MAPASAVVLVMDRLGAGWLGPYGNTWLDTPHCNQLAAQSLLWENAVAESPDLAAAYSGYWTGAHPRAAAAGVPTLAELAKALGLGCFLITDETQVARHPLAEAFSECLLLQRPDCTGGAEASEQTWLAHFFESAAVAVRQQPAPALTWIHCSGLAGPWDAPHELRTRFADEDDPVPPTLVEPPERLLQPGFDPDELLGIVHAYAGQVSLLDECLGQLLAALDDHAAAQEVFFAVTSPRGYPLGEHLRIGGGEVALYSELLQVPLMVRPPRRPRAPARSQTIVQPHELYSAIAQSCGWMGDHDMALSMLAREMGGVPSGIAAAAYSFAERERAIRTPAWFLRQSLRDQSPRYELFAKPDDRWEANEISSRCVDVAELLAARLDEFETAAGASKIADLPPLAWLLCDSWR